MVTPQTAIQKGKLLENSVAQEIRKKRLDTMAMRQLGSGSGLWKGDVNTKLKIMGRQAIFECKNQQRLNLREAWIQTDRQALGYGFPILVIKFYNEPVEASKAMVYLDTFLELVKRASEPKLKDPDRETQYLVRQMIELFKRFEKKLK